MNINTMSKFSSFYKFYKKQGPLSVVLSVILSVLFVVTIVKAATTISTNISTGGTLSVTGASTLTGAVAASSTLQVTGAFTTYGNGTFGDASADINLFTGALHASSTSLFTSGLTTYGASTFGDAGGDINLFTGTLQASTTALFTGAATFYGNVTLGDAAADVITLTGNASTTNALTVGSSLYVNGYATTTGSNGNIATEGTLNVNGNVTLGDAAADTLTVTASTTLANTAFGTGNATITGHLSASSTINFDSTPASSCNTKTAAVTGAAANNTETVVLGLPDGLATIASSTFKAWISAANTVAIQMCLFAGAATTDPGPQNVRIDVWKH